MNLTNMKYKWLLFLVTALFISGCGSDDNEKKATERISDEQYQIVFPYESSDARNLHIEYNRGENDVMDVSKGLMKISGEYFDVNDYYLQDGQLLTRDILATNTYYHDYKGLLGFKSKKNPIGLNPKVNSYLKVDGKKIKVNKQMIPIVDIFEQDFYNSLSKKADLKALSLAIVVNPTFDNGKEKLVMSNQELMTYIKKVTPSLLKSLRKLSKINDDTKILITVYKASSDDDYLPGTFIAKGLVDNQKIDYEKINEKWVVLPSGELNQLDESLNKNMISLQKSLTQFLPTNTSLIGKAKFNNDELVSIDLDVNTEIKNYDEIVGLCQYLKEKIPHLTKTNCDIIVRVENNNETLAMLEINKQGQVNIIMK